MVASNIDVSNTTPDLAELIDRANTKQEIITLTDKGEKSAVLISLEAFNHLVGSRRYSQRDSMPKNEFQEAFGCALAEAGYDSRDKIIDLVREVKLEMYEERRRQS